MKIESIEFKLLVGKPFQWRPRNTWTDISDDFNGFQYDWFWFRFLFRWWYSDEAAARRGHRRYRSDPRYEHLKRHRQERFEECTSYPCRAQNRKYREVC